ncbi:MAG: UDP-glucose 4-epimerase GalE [Spirochaetes bacterium]|nr:MAG: UDP-glucose 4-epimerase GalE [Spirochaetota bacterium]
MRILVTGGAGYIGSHTIIALQESGHEVHVVDNLSNSSYEAIERVMQITGQKVTFYNNSILDTEAMNRIFETATYDAVIHFAAFKAVGESVAKPLKYYHNNISGTVSLLEAMNKNGVKNIVFSSSATVYGDPQEVPIDESFPLSAANPYGRTKLMMEEILTDLYNAEKDWNVIILRYFNPVGAHKSGTIGEDPNGIPNNLMPYISQVAIGKLERLSVFGNDYPTKDGTGVRDYIHVTDLAEGHVKALSRITPKGSLSIYNLGTGKGYSVLEMIQAFEKASGKKIPYTIAPRRPGDIAECWASPLKAEKELGWKASRGIDEMCADAWNWQKNNPMGYEK